VHYNGKGIGLSGYLEMLERDFREIPDLSFEIQLLIAEPNPQLSGRRGPRSKASMCRASA
jgi:predicted ester cyclase